MGGQTRRIERAPAKINLTLHITGRRPDGYHELDSLVAFASVYDRITVDSSAKMSLAIEGPRGAGIPADAGNLVWQAAEAMAPEHPVAITLYKRLPAAAGIGGGSSDAAATFRAMQKLIGATIPDTAAQLALGSDIPVCMTTGPQRMRGTGGNVTEVSIPHGVWLVLANPGVKLSTAEVFAALESTENPPMEDVLPFWSDKTSFVEWLAEQRNDMQAAAISLAPEIDEVLTALSELPGCALARMSGSGATCFGVFTTEGEARFAATALRWARSDWWVAAGDVLRQ